MQVWWVEVVIVLSFDLECSSLLNTIFEEEMQSSKVCFRLFLQWVIKKNHGVYSICKF